jgi:UDP-N-acetylmuramoyl-tripeptide--D-alanyl-D-alanine ligase
MIQLSLAEIAAVTQGQLIGSDVSITKVNTDTRDNSADSLFIALKGRNFDAHQFLAEAVQQGAVALLVEQQTSMAIPQVVVANTRLALGQLAHLVRQKSKARFIGLTGSVGKTTVKEMLHHLLRHCGATLATQGNLNNDIGVPLTLMRLTENEEFAVIEMGANQPGDIEYTVGLVEPEVALINNVAAAHLEGFGDLQGVAQAKGEIYQGIRKGGVAIVNADDRFAEFWRTRIDHPMITFGIVNDADISAKHIELDASGCAAFELKYPDGLVDVRLSVAGKHNVYNAIAAFSVCYALKLDLKPLAERLATFSGVKGRLQIHRLNNQSNVIDDTYNANYTSLTAAIDVLTQQKGKKVLALGDMGELGEQAREYHQKAGLYAREAGIDELLTIGVLSQFAHQAFGDGAHHFSSQQQMTEYLIQQLEQSPLAVLLKGSRSAHMERVVEPLLTWAQQNLGGAQ